ncbi:hypothetical protein [Streptomyces sp.]
MRSRVLVGQELGSGLRLYRSGTQLGGGDAARRTEDERVVV